MTTNPREVGWFFHPPAKREVREPVAAPPVSQIPGLGHPSPPIAEKPRDMMFNENDTEYLRLAKMGGRKDLLSMHPRDGAPRREPKPYRRSEWYYLEDNAAEERAAQNTHPVQPYISKIPDYMVHQTAAIKLPQLTVSGSAVKCAPLPSYATEPAGYSKKQKKIRPRYVIQKSKRSLSLDGDDNRPLINYPKFNVSSEPTTMTKLLSYTYDKEWHAKRSEINFPAQQEEKLVSNKRPCPLALTRGFKPRADIIKKPAAPGVEVPGADNSNNNDNDLLIIKKMKRSKREWNKFGKKPTPKRVDKSNNNDNEKYFLKMDGNRFLKKPAAKRNNNDPSSEPVPSACTGEKAGTSDTKTATSAKSTRPVTGFSNSELNCRANMSKVGTNGKNKMTENGRKSRSDKKTVPVSSNSGSERNEPSGSGNTGSGINSRIGTPKSINKYVPISTNSNEPTSGKMIKPACSTSKFASAKTGPTTVISAPAARTCWAGNTTLGPAGRTARKDQPTKEKPSTSTDAPKTPVSEKVRDAAPPAVKKETATPGHKMKDLTCFPSPPNKGEPLSPAESVEDLTIKPSPPFHKWEPPSPASSVEDLTIKPSPPFREPPSPASSVEDLTIKPSPPLRKWEPPSPASSVEDLTIKPSPPFRKWEPPSPASSVEDLTINPSPPPLCKWEPPSPASSYDDDTPSPSSPLMRQPTSPMERVDDPTIKVSPPLSSEEESPLLAGIRNLRDAHTLRVASRTHFPAPGVEDEATTCTKVDVGTTSQTYAEDVAASHTMSVEGEAASHTPQMYDQTCTSSPGAEDEVGSINSKVEDEAVSISSRVKDEAVSTSSRVEGEATSTSSKMKDEAASTSSRLENEAASTGSRGESEATSTSSRGDNEAASTGSRGENEAASTGPIVEGCTPCPDAAEELAVSQSVKDGANKNEHENGDGPEHADDIGSGDAANDKGNKLLNTTENENNQGCYDYKNDLDLDGLKYEDDFECDDAAASSTQKEDEFNLNGHKYEDDIEYYDEAAPSHEKENELELDELNYEDDFECDDDAATTPEKNYESDLDGHNDEDDIECYDDASLFSEKEAESDLDGNNYEDDIDCLDDAALFSEKEDESDLDEQNYESDIEYDDDTAPFSEREDELDLDEHSYESDFECLNDAAPSPEKEE